MKENEKPIKRQKIVVTVTAIAEFDIEEIENIGSWFDDICGQGQITEKYVKVV